MDRTITTAGFGQASGTPDAMRISVAVVVRAATVADALAGTSSGVAALGELARRFTTDERIGSTGLNVWPYHDNEGRQVGYEARHALSIYCPDLGKAGELVTALGDLADRVLVDGIQPVIADPSPLAAVARERAWSDARAKAEELAALADVAFEAGSQEVSASLTVTWSLAPAGS